MRGARRSRLTGYCLASHVASFRRVLAEVDAIAVRNGGQFHAGGVHLNTRGGVILAAVVQAYLDT